MSKTAICWLGDSVILAIALSLAFSGWDKSSLAVSFIGFIGWGTYTGIKGWSFFGKRRPRG